MHLPSQCAPQVPGNPWVVNVRTDTTDMWSPCTYIHTYSTYIHTAYIHTYIHTYIPVCRGGTVCVATDAHMFIHLNGEQACPHPACVVIGGERVKHVLASKRCEGRTRNRRSPQRRRHTVLTSPIASSRLLNHTDYVDVTHVYRRFCVATDANMFTHLDSEQVC
jgi:hypothetical protein